MDIELNEKFRILVMIPFPGHKTMSGDVVPVPIDKIKEYINEEHENKTSILEGIINARCEDIEFKDGIIRGHEYKIGELTKENEELTNKVKQHEVTIEGIKILLENQTKETTK